jgi:hypothetical protein
MKTSNLIDQKSIFRTALGECQSSFVNPSCMCIQTILPYMYILSVFNGKKLCICQWLYLPKNPTLNAVVYLILITAIQLQYTHFYTLTVTSNELGHSAAVLDISPATTFQWRMVTLHAQTWNILWNVHVARQWPRNKQLYNSHFLVMAPWTRVVLR